MPSAPTSTTPPPAFELPDPRHLARLPAHVGPEQLNRIRRAAYNLPQVVTPGDCGIASEADPSAHAVFERLGYIQLQKAVSGARPSRWIAPGLIDIALAHLAAVGNGPTVRALMLERTATLDTLGVFRDGAEWRRTHSRALAMQNVDWQITVRFQTPVDAGPIWDFYRSGDLPALEASLGPAPAYPHAETLRAHLDALVARSLTFPARYLDSLQPRLQAECDRPQPIQALLAACSRAQERWEQRAVELDTLEGLNSELAFQGYPDTFVLARRLQRTITLYVGAPNSGKTHAAFERLAKAHTGAYLAPLRLLALEGRDRLVARGVACSLLTGEENVPAPGAGLVSSTIEMVATNRPIDVAVIDEAQMIFDASRGWAWTQAIVGVPADEVIIICSSYAVPAIQNLLGLCGERSTVRRFERMQHVELLPHAVPLPALQKGDAVVAFSRRDVLMLRDQIASSGHPVSVIYGALPPEVRRREAERFAEGESDILVATDAIGMGLNLPIRRVLFSTVTKFDGVGDRPLSESEAHQIAGRAGRYGIHEEGFAGVLADSEPGSLRKLRELLATPPRAPADFKAPVAPNAWHVDTIATRLGKTRLRDVLGVFVEQLKLDNAHFQVAELDQMLELAEQLDRRASRLSLQQRFVYAQAPVDTRTDAQVQEFLDWSSSHASTGRAGSPWFLRDVDGHSRLDRMEQALRSCTLWLWLDLRFEGVYGDVDEVLALREELNNGIERQLKGKRPLAQMRRGMRRR
ncbi:helicase-related protein [Piscinibacter koreensis]|uniref:Helicase n=1 Tax=Piscinibacter koreensis TaxID=2742824 RepID=A0A7Y6TW92_9BURK|nr:helicase-related protein [Schlegelella koreensis]NUZ05884.1 helicase [Schlegelella koreensis]